jgi:hypothetical protein
MKRFKNKPYSIKHFESILAGSTDRANPVFGKIFESGPGYYPGIGITVSRIVHITTDVANIFFHFNLLVQAAANYRSPPACRPFIIKTNTLNVNASQVDFLDKAICIISYIIYPPTIISTQIIA